MNTSDPTQATTYPDTYPALTYTHGYHSNQKHHETNPRTWELHRCQSFDGSSSPMWQNSSQSPFRCGGKSCLPQVLRSDEARRLVWTKHSCCSSSSRNKV